MLSSRDLKPEAGENASAHRSLESRVARGPTKRAQLRIAHLLIAFAAFARARVAGWSRNWLPQPRCQPFVGLDRLDWLISHDVENLAGVFVSPFREQKQRAHYIITVDVV